MADKVLAPSHATPWPCSAPELDPECWIVWGDDPAVR